MAAVKATKPGRRSRYQRHKDIFIIVAQEQRIVREQNDTGVS